MKNLGQDKRGIVLVLTLIIMAVLVSVAVGFGTLVISDIRQAKAVDDSMAAYFAAETGIERSLFLLRKQDGISGLAGLASTTGALDNSSSWDIASSTSYEPNYLRQRLKSGQSAKLFFLGRETASGLGQGYAKSILVDWNKGSGSAAKIQVTLTRLKADNLGDDGEVYLTDLSEVRVATGTMNCFAFEDSPTVSDYVGEIKVLGSSDDDYVATVRVTGYANDDCTGDVVTEAISNINLVSDGTFGISRQRMIASLPPMDTALGLLNFVLFSEEDITKR